MSRQQGSNKRRLTEQVLVRLDPLEHARVLREAQSQDITLAALTRNRLLGLRIIPRTDAKLINELRRLGGIAMMALRTRGMADEGNQALRDIRKAIAHLADPS